MSARPGYQLLAERTKHARKLAAAAGFSDRQTQELIDLHVEHRYPIGQALAAARLVGKRFAAPRAPE